MYDKTDLYIDDIRIIETVEESIKTNPAFVQIGNYSDFKYSLMNGKTHANAHGLTVHITQKTRGDNIAPPTMHIWGSLRKWGLGALSMNDLTRLDTLEALHKLAEELGIPYCILKELPLSSVEVGLNLDLGDLSCESVKNRISSFKDIRYKCMDAEGYKVFKTGKTSGKVYDKMNETRKAITKISDKLGADRFENLNRGRKILRTEFKAHGGANLVSRFFGIRTVGDMVDRYNWVALKWLQLALKFDFKGTDMLPFAPVKESTKEFMDYIKCRGLLDIGEVELQAMLSRLSVQTRKDVRNAIKRTRRKMPDAVNTCELFRRIAKAQFAQQFNRSYRQFHAALDAAHSPTLL